MGRWDDGTVGRWDDSADIKTFSLSHCLIVSLSFFWDYGTVGRWDEYCAQWVVVGSGR